MSLQIRKNHFPPRPKRRKKRSKKKTKVRRKQQHEQTIKSPSTSDEEEEETVRMEQQNGGKWKDGCKIKCRSHETSITDGKISVKGRKCHLTREMCVANSAGETVESDEEASVGGSTKGGSLGGVPRSRVNSGSSCGGGRVNGGSGDVGHSSLGDRKRRSSRISMDLLLEEDEEEEEEDHDGAVMRKKPRLDCRFENKFFKNVMMEQQSEESGVLSCTSSQELSPMSSLGTILPESQETFCEELELERAKVLNPLSEVWEETDKDERMKKDHHLDEGENLGRCIMCLEEPKNGVFVHSRFLHLCCCYKCAVKVWNKHKRCPICNSKVKNVLKLFVH